MDDIDDGFFASDPKVGADRQRIVEFAKRWRDTKLTERSGAQQHFLGLCLLFGHDQPSVDQTGDYFTFEKRVGREKGSYGFADVWKKGEFVFEYKKKNRSLKDAWLQLQLYRDELDNPKLLVTCDFYRFNVRTNFTGTPTQLYEFTLDDLLSPLALGEKCPKPPLFVLRAIFEDPERLRPEKTTAEITMEAAVVFARLADDLRNRGVDAYLAARFLVRIVFSLFAEDMGLLEANQITTMISRALHRRDPEGFSTQLKELWQKMATGGWFGPYPIRRFNGGLFDVAQEEWPQLNGPQLRRLELLAKMDWKYIEPAIFGTLFERGLDPSKRAQLGAHYTSEADIRAIVEPVLMEPLRNKWSGIREELEAKRLQWHQLASVDNPDPLPGPKLKQEIEKIQKEMERLLRGFVDELQNVHVLDPACGSGNFLYVSLKSLLDFGSEVVAKSVIEYDLNSFSYDLGPEQMHGIEIDPYAHELAAIVVWIGFIQWRYENEGGGLEDPILKGLELIRHGDALVNSDGTEAEWPAVTAIVGNPPFLGDKRMRSELGDEYVDRLRTLYAGRVDGGADLVTYWFEKARAMVEAGTVQRVGLLTTNGIRFGANRNVLNRIKAMGDIFMAWSDRPWIQDGADVRVSMVAFDNGTETTKMLNGVSVETINTDLSSRPDVTQAAALAENDNLVFLGMMKAGPFDIQADFADYLLKAGPNPNRKPNSDVVKRRLGAQAITQRLKESWIIDFGEMTEAEAALYEKPFEYVRKQVKPIRDENRREGTRKRWWRFGEARPALRAALAGKKRCLVTPEVTKYRVFVWMPTDWIPDHSCHVFARDDDYFFGVLQSRVHEVWTLALCNWMGAGNDPRYNSSKIFATFPMPWKPGEEPAEKESAVVDRIAEAGRRLTELRNNVTLADGSTESLGSIYNSRPSWLNLAHKDLDRAVLAAYAHVTGDEWPESLTDDELLSRLLALNHDRAGKSE